MKIKSFLNNRAQQTIEYLLVFGGVITVILVAMTENGLMQRNVEGGLEQAVVGIECMAETACFDPAGLCVPECGNGCCEPGETAAGCAADCSSAGCTPSVSCGVGDCGTINNGCGVLLFCGSCPSGQFCNAANSCQCAPSDPCALGMCGAGLDDGCGTPVVCPPCSAPLSCQGGFCVCVDDPPATTCSGPIQCGVTTNNCGNPVDCGGCTSPDVCQGNTCCTPDPLATTCAGLECGSTVKIGRASCRERV